MIKSVLLLAKEFVEGEAVSEYVRRLAAFLAGKGVEVHIVCSGAPAAEETGELIHVHRVQLPIHGDNLFNWSMMMNNELKRKAREIFEGPGFDIVHGNDWTTSTSAMSIAKFSERPLVVTIHSTEKERGFGARHSGIISDLEWWLTYEACCVLSNNEKTYHSLRNDLQLPQEKIRNVNLAREEWETEVLETYKRIAGKTQPQCREASG